MPGSIWILEDPPGLFRTRDDWDGPKLRALVRFDACIQMYDGHEERDIDIHTDSQFENLVTALTELLEKARLIVLDEDI